MTHCHRASRICSNAGPPPVGLCTARGARWCSAGSSQTLARRPQSRQGSRTNFSAGRSPSISMPSTTQVQTSASPRARRRRTARRWLRPGSARAPWQRWPAVAASSSSGLARRAARAVRVSARRRRSCRPRAGSSPRKCHDRGGALHGAPGRCRQRRAAPDWPYRASSCTPPGPAGAAHSAHRASAPYPARHCRARGRAANDSAGAAAGERSSPPRTRSCVGASAGPSGARTSPDRAPTGQPRAPTAPTAPPGQWHPGRCSANTRRQSRSAANQANRITMAS